MPTALLAMRTSRVWDGATAGAPSSAVPGILLSLPLPPGMTQVSHEGTTRMGAIVALHPPGPGDLGDTSRGGQQIPQTHPQRGTEVGGRQSSPRCAPWGEGRAALPPPPGLEKQSRDAPGASQALSSTLGCCSPPCTLLGRARGSFPPSLLPLPPSPPSPSSIPLLEPASAEQAQTPDVGEML